MKPTGATFVRNTVEPGWPILSQSVPLGRRYVVDLDRVVALRMINVVTLRSVEVDCVLVLEPGPPGWLPLLALRLDES